MAHRVDSADTVLEGGLRRFEDQSLPGTNGTVDAREWNNAVQEEICNVIELNGVTIASGAVTDRAAGWQQLYDVIFTSGKIIAASIGGLAITTPKLGTLSVTDAKVNDVSVSKLTSGTISITDVIGGPTTVDWTQDSSRLILDATGPAGTFQMNLTASIAQIKNTGVFGTLTLEPNGVALSGNTGHIIDLTDVGLLMTNTGTDTGSEMTDTEINITFDDAVDEKQSRIIPQKMFVNERASGAGSAALGTQQTARGIIYDGTASPGIAALKTQNVRRTTFEYTGNFFARDALGNYQVNGSLTLTGVEKTAVIYSIWASYTGDDTGNTKLSPVKIASLTNDGTDRVLDDFLVLQNDLAVTPDGPETATDSVFLYIEYDASNI